MTPALSCASSVEAPRCGETTTWGSSKSGDSVQGSLAKTSRPAPATMPSRMASASASSSTIPPRAVLTMRMPGLALARRSRPKSPTVSGVFGVWMETKSASRHELLDADQAHAHGPGPVVRDEGVVADQFHAEGVRSLGDQRTGPAQADHAEHLAVQLDALPLGALPTPGHQSRVGLRDVAGLCQQEGHGLLRHREDVGGGRVDHHDPALGGRGHVHVVEPDTGPAHDLRDVPAARTSAVTWVEERMISASAPTMAPRSSSGLRPSWTSTSWPALGSTGPARSGRSSRLPVPVPPRWSPHSPRWTGSVLRFGEELGQPGHTLDQVVFAQRVGHAEVARCAESLARERPPPWPR